MDVLKQKIHNGFAIALAWPATNCKQAGAWYDALLSLLAINKSGYYQVGHSAIVLVSDSSEKCHYFDFGRYHAPHGFGRIRSALTDHDLKIKTLAKKTEDKTTIINVSSILKEIYANPSTHGDGPIYGSVTRINFQSALDYAISFQEKEFIPYGPFISKGTNCSRFVNKVMQKGWPKLVTRLLLKFPATISPTPMWNVKAAGRNIRKINNVKYKKEDMTLSNPEINILSA